MIFKTKFRIYIHNAQHIKKKKNLKRLCVLK